MAQYTEFLYRIVDVYCDGDFNNLFQNITTSLPIENNIRSKLYEHYKYFEIGFETAELFMHEFKTKYNELVPRIRLYYDAMMDDKFKMLNNDTRTRIYELVRNAENNSNIISDSKSQFKDTPYTSYQTDTQFNTTVTDGNSSSENSSEISQNDTYEETMNGLVGITPAEAIKRYMDIWIDIEVWLIKEFRELFMEVY